MRMQGNNYGQETISKGSSLRRLPNSKSMSILGYNSKAPSPHANHQSPKLQNLPRWTLGRRDASSKSIGRRWVEAYFFLGLGSSVTLTESRLRYS